MSDTVQIMLIADCAAEAIKPLSQALSRFDIACVLLVPPGWRAGATNKDDFDLHQPQTIDAVICKELVELVQRHEAAAIVANDASVAQAANADGCHLDYSDGWEDAYQSTRAFLGAGAIVGVAPGRTRHTAMTLAEAGADYIAYHVSGGDEDEGMQFVGWWAEIFESPVVAFTDGDVLVCREAIEAGPPDFLAVPLRIGSDTSHLLRIVELIEERGQLPVAAKDAK